jgi:hypothetical protein
VAREYARIRLSIAEDDEFENLSPAAQWLYLRVLLPEPSLNYAGVCDWRPNRLLRKARGIDLPYILAAAAELEEHLYVLFDGPTEQALIRTYIRGDELLRNPKMALAVVSGYQETASDPLRAFIVSELQRDKEDHPDYSSWTHEISKDAIARLLTKPNADAVQYTNQIQVPITNGITNPDPSPDYQSDSVGIPSHLAPNTIHQAPDTFEAAQAPPAPTKKGHRLAADWYPSKAVIAEMEAECPNVDFRIEHRKFVDYWTDKTGKDATKLDWTGTWRNWIRRAGENPRALKVVNGSGSTVDDKVNGWLDLANTSGGRELE